MDEQEEDGMKRKVCRALAGVGLAALAAGAAASACSGAEDCADNGTCPHSQASSSGGTTGGDPGAACVPKKGEPPPPDECGLWVSSSQGHDGSYGGFKYAPVRSIKEALKRVSKPDWAGARIYVCAEEFTGHLVVPAGTMIYGGLDCNDGWIWIGDTRKSTVKAPPDLVAMRLSAGEGTTRVEDLTVVAADGHEPGRSSIAALASGVTAELVRCELVAGDATDGAPGAPGAEPSMPGGQIPHAKMGMNGKSGTVACLNLFETSGGAATQGSCDDSTSSTGGKGGNGRAFVGVNGDAGTPGTSGIGGIGQPTATGSWKCDTIGKGHNGNDGADGALGQGALGLGSLSVKSGYLGVDGLDGASGVHGHAGGGGGGARGPTVGQGCAGASGGSGGSGGCGGLPGQGGQAGGSSITLVSLDANVMLTDCSLTAGKGGRGGAGGDSQPGGHGGAAGQGGIGLSGGSASKNACPGGTGGHGGAGGPGGGGLGGHSIVIAFSGTPVARAGAVTLTPGSSAEGGPGGNSNTQSNAGEGGVIAEEQEMLQAEP